MKGSLAGRLAWFGAFAPTFFVCQWGGAAIVKDFDEAMGGVLGRLTTNLLQVVLMVGPPMLLLSATARWGLPAAWQRRKERQASQSSLRRWLPWVGLFVAVIAVGLLLRHYGASSEEMLFWVGDDRLLVPTARLVETARHAEGGLLYETLAKLRQRKDWSAAEQARHLLTSAEPRAWFSGAAYLAAMGDKEALPYLIKALKRPRLLSCDRNDVLSGLRALSGRDYGTDYSAWHEWWEREHPGSGFDFSSFGYEAVEAWPAPAEGETEHGGCC